MMGQGQEAQAALFYEFALEGHVPEDRLVRPIDRFVGPGEIGQYLAPYYSRTGRPSVYSDLMTRILIVGNFFGNRSERRLCGGCT